MRCFECNKGKYSTTVTDITADVRGEKFTVSVEAEVCNRCGSQVLTNPQSAAYAVASADAYREKHGLLTTTELKGVRKRLGMSQQTFANYLHVGVASVKRWEAGLIQDESHDELIRLKTDLQTARSNVAHLEARAGISEGPYFEVTIPVAPTNQIQWEPALREDHVPAMCPTA